MADSPRQDSQNGAERCYVQFCKLARGHAGPHQRREPTSLTKEPRTRQNAGSRPKGARSRRGIGEAVGDVIDAIVDALTPW